MRGQALAPGGVLLGEAGGEAGGKRGGSAPFFGEAPLLGPLCTLCFAVPAAPGAGWKFPFYKFKFGKPQIPRIVGASRVGKEVL